MERGNSIHNVHDKALTLSTLWKLCFLGQTGRDGNWKEIYPDGSEKHIQALELRRISIQEIQRVGRECYIITPGGSRKKKKKKSQSNM